MQSVETQIAVVIPCFNDGRVLLEAVESAPVEVSIDLVVVDDGSTDEHTLGLLNDLSAAGHVRIVRQENSGPASARMTGVEATSAPYIYPLDADDALLPGALERLAAALDAHPRAGFAYGDYQIFGEYEGLWRTPDQFDRWALTYGNFYPCCSLIRRVSLMQAGGWARDMKSGYEDWDMWMSFAERGIDGVKVSGGPVYRRRLHGEDRVDRRARERHEALYAGLRRRHPTLFSARRALREQYRPSLAKRIAYPIVLGPRNILPLAVESWLKRQTFKRAIRV